VKLLLDTHALLWLAHEPESLSAAAAAAIADDANEILVSAVSAIEISTKSRLGKLEYRTSLATNFVTEVTSQGFVPISVTCAHAERAGNLEGDHRDPWDRLLAAQAEKDELVVVTCDARIAGFGVNTIW
jgi:PIN domain nuclease of toxin-antitoxin system